MTTFIMVLLIACIAPVCPAEAGAQGVSVEQPDQTRKQAAEESLRDLEGLEDADVTVSGQSVTVTGTADDPAVTKKAEELVRVATGAAEVNNKVELTQDVGDRIRGATARVETRLDRWLVLIPLLPLAVAVVVAAVLVAWIVSRWRWPYDRFAQNRFLAHIIRRFVQVAIVGLGVLLALEILDATALVGGVLGAAGVAGIAIGFAFRDLVENYIASVLLSTRQPFRAKDHVIIDGHEGLVTALTSRSTVLTTFDGNLVRIPNATVFKTPIINYTVDPRRRFSFTVGVGYDVDLAEAVRVGVEIVTDTPGVMAEPAPFAVVTTLGDSNITIEVFGWIDQSVHDFGRVRSVSIQRVKIAFDDRDIDMPEPIYTIRMDDPSTARSRRKQSKQIFADQDVSRDNTVREFVAGAGQDADGTDLLVHPDDSQEL